jgi:hypothetical protein
VRGLAMNDVKLSYLKEDARAPFIFSDAKSVDLRNITAPHASGVPGFILKDIEDFSLQHSWPLADVRIKKAMKQQF